MAKQRSDLLTAQALRDFAALLEVAFHSVCTCVSHVMGSTAEPAEPDDTRRYLLRDQWAATSLRMTVAAAE